MFRILTASLGKTSVIATAGISKLDCADEKSLIFVHFFFKLQAL